MTQQHAISNTRSAPNKGNNIWTAGGSKTTMLFNGPAITTITLSLPASLSSRLVSVPFFFPAGCGSINSFFSLFSPPKRHDHTSVEASVKQCSIMAIFGRPPRLPIPPETKSPGRDGRCASTIPSILVRIPMKSQRSKYK